MKRLYFMCVSREDVCIKIVESEKKNWECASAFVRKRERKSFAKSVY